MLYTYMCANLIIAGTLTMSLHNLSLVCACEHVLLWQVSEEVGHDYRGMH